MKIRLNAALGLAAILMAGCTTVNESSTINAAQSAAAQKPSPPGLPFSPVVEAGGVLYLAGHLGRHPETRTYDPRIEVQTTQTLQNIAATLAGIGASMSDIVRCQVFMTDITEFSQMNRAYRQFFPTNPPARTTVGIAGLAAPDARIEIECTAVRNKP